MDLKIALAGNPNCGKTTLFNALTGANQYVGNWPGVTVEKKEGKLKKHDGRDHSWTCRVSTLCPRTRWKKLSPATIWCNERPDAILNIVDGTNLERNLYLTTQLMRAGHPGRDRHQHDGRCPEERRQDQHRAAGRSAGAARSLRSPRAEGRRASWRRRKLAIEAGEAGQAASRRTPLPAPSSTPLRTSRKRAVHESARGRRQRWYAVKIFERDDKVL